MNENPSSSRGISPAALSAMAAGDFENAIVALTPGGIEAQEKRGQMREATRQTLPADMGEYRSMFEKLGFKLGKKVDDLFIEAVFPAGWSKRPTDHAMHSDIIDDKGRRRGGIFYKAAFYDRSANVHLSRRFGVSRNYDNNPVTFFIKDECGEVQKTLGPFDPVDWQGPRDKALFASAKLEAAQKELSNWLKAEYPDCDSPLAYWD